MDPHNKSTLLAALWAFYLVIFVPLFWFVLSEPISLWIGALMATYIEPILVKVTALSLTTTVGAIGSLNLIHNESSD